MKAVMRILCCWHTLHPCGAIWSEITGQRQGMHSKWLTLMCSDCTDTVTLWSQGGTVYILADSWPACLDLSRMQSERQQGLGEPRLLLLLNANSATTPSVPKKTPRYHRCEVGEVHRLWSKRIWVGSRCRECPCQRTWPRNGGKQQQQQGWGGSLDEMCWWGESWWPQYSLGALFKRSQ